MNRFRLNIGAVSLLFFAVSLLVSCEPVEPDTAQEQMTGTWKYVEEGTRNACQVQISADGSDGLRISNFACLQLTIKATLVDDNHLSIPNQTVSSDKFEGSGTIKKFKTMVLNFTYDNGREKVKIVANCEKLE